jgi:RIO-like serine/threonine protein kinase
LPWTLQSAANSPTKKTPFTEPDVIYPYPKTFIHRETAEKQEFMFEAEMNRRSLLFTGKIIADNKRICIKFVHQYGSQVHLWFAHHHHAPDLIACDTLDGGRWWMVVMELLDVSWICLADAKNPSILLKDSILSTIKNLHSAGMVHGDLHDMNIMVKRDGGKEFMVLDYDWAGIDGQVRSPLFVNKAPDLG